MSIPKRRRLRPVLPAAREGHRLRHQGGRWPVVWLGIWFWLGAGAFAASVTNGPVRGDRGFSYEHDQVAEIPWSIHIIRIERAHRDLGFCTTLGNGGTLGMSTVPQQVKSLPLEVGRPLAAVNGDFYDTSRDYMGRPRGLQIHLGEVITDPSKHAVFWIDPAGEPCLTNIVSRFRVLWADGTATPFSLNGPRASDAAALYTCRMGDSTRTSAGTELVLEAVPDNPWLPLRPGQTCLARVREVRTASNTPLNCDTAVLSIGPKLLPRLPSAQPGATLRIVTEMTPDLAGVRTAIGGGPTLVRNGVAMQWGGIQLRHPRTAIGWNKDCVFLVEVDGRQTGLSAGMTFPELAAYMLRLGCEEAMGLDGGGSATLWAYGNVMNSPSEGRERPVANALVLVDTRPAPD